MANEVQKERERRRGDRRRGERREGERRLMDRRQGGRRQEDCSKDARKPKRGLSFRVLVMLPFSLVLVLQTVLAVVVLTRSGVLDSIENDAYGLFSERVSSHAESLEDDMVFRWTNFGETPAVLQDTIDDVLRANGATTSDLAFGSDLSLSVIEAVANDVLSLTDVNEVEGVYFILNDAVQEAGQEGDSPHTALYVRDSNPVVNSPSWSDLLLAACPLSVARAYGLALDSAWSSSFPLAPEGDARSDFYYKPLRAAEQHPDADVADLCYWGRPANLGWAGTPSITYSIPLRDGAGNVCGVFGIAVRLDRLTTFFPADELADDGSGSYVLAISNTASDEGGALGDASSQDGQRRYEVLATTGASHILYAEDGVLTTMVDDQGRTTIAALDKGASDEPAVASTDELLLYDTTSPFADDHWVLVGLQSERTLFASAHTVVNMLLQVFLVSLILGLVLAVVMAWASSSRIRRLVGEVRAARSGHVLTFRRTAIAEVDELADAIRVYGDEVKATSARLSNVLALSDRMIGAFERSERTGMVTVTDGFFATLGITEGSVADEVQRRALENKILKSRDLRAMLEPLLARAEVEGVGRFLLSVDAGRRWVRLTLVGDMDDSNAMGLVEDVTDEIETLRSIERERDHDFLTGLLNRRAFDQQVNALLAAAPSRVAALLMFDLDNLKGINDTYGHDWGDIFIRTAGDVMNDVLADAAVFGRVSGDEFLVFATTDVAGHDARVRLTRLFEDFRQALMHTTITPPDGVCLNVRASMGVAFFPDDADNLEELRKYADYAMYEVKRTCKGGLRAFDKAAYHGTELSFDAECSECESAEGERHDEDEPREGKHAER